MALIRKTAGSLEDLKESKQSEAHGVPQDRRRPGGREHRGEPGAARATEHENPRRHPCSLDPRGVSLSRACSSDVCTWKILFSLGFAFLQEPEIKNETYDKHTVDVSTEKPFQSRTGA